MLQEIDLRKLTWGVTTNRGGSAGMLPKDTYISKGITYFVKMSAYNMSFGVYGIESISEVLASRLGLLLGFNCAHYELYNALVKKDGKEFKTYLSISKSYNPKNYDRLPFEEFYMQHRIPNERPFEFVVRSSWSSEIFEMFVFDYIINNFDRHGANIEIYMNEKEEYVLFPLFDHGNSLYHTFDEGRIQGAYYGDDCIAQNFIGGPYLGKNMELISSPVRVTQLSENARDKLFENLDEIVTPNRQKTIWNHIVRRFEICKTLKVITY